VILALDEKGIVYRIRNTKAEKIPMRPFIIGIAAVGELVVCVSTTGHCFLAGPGNAVEQLREELETCILRSFTGQAAVIESGRILLVFESDGRKVLKFSDRIGRLLDCCKSSEDFVLVVQ
jgi:hypothetical protein